MAAAASHVAVRCSLPHGIILHDAMDKKKTIELKGKNKAVLIGGNYGTTMVPGDFWEQWIAVNADFPAVSSGAIYAAKNAADLDAMSKEFKDRKNGFEPMSQDAFGVKKATKDE